MRPPQQLPPPRMAAQPPQQIVQQGALLVSSPPPAGSQAAHSSLQTPPSGSLNRRRWPPSVNSGGTSAARPAGPAVPALPLAAASHFGPSPTAASGPTTVHLQQQVATPTEGLNSQHQHLIALTSPSPTTSGRVAVTQPPVPAGHARGSDLRHINPHHGQPAATNGLFSGPGAAGSNLRHPQQLLPPQGQQQQQQNLPGLLPSPTRSLAPLARRFVDGGGSHQPTGAPPTTGNPGGATASSAPFATPSSGAVGGGQNSLAASQQPSSAVGQIPLQAGGAHMLAANGRPPRAGGATIPQGSVDGGPGVMVSATGGNDSNAARQYPGADPQQQKQDYGTVAAGAPPPGRTRGALGQQRPPIMHGPIGMPVSRSSESKGSPQHATAVSQLQAPLQHLHQQHPQGASPTPAFKGAGSAAGTRGHQRAPHQVSSAASKGAGGGPNFKNNENGIQSPQSAATPGRGTPQTHRTTGGRSSAGGASVSTSVGGASNGTTATTVTQMSTIRGRKYNHWRMQRDPQSVVQSMLLSSRHSYRLDRLLQTAIYGAVYHATEINQQGYKRAVAIKIMVKETERRNRGTLQEDMFAEMKFHKELKGHPNLLVYDYCWDDKDCVYVVMPYAEYEDLFEVLKKRKVPLAEREARWLFAQILDGTAYLNSKGVAFRDHSLENVLMFHNPEDGTVFPKITDPGQAVSFQVDAQHRVKGLVADKLFGKSFRPPEVYSKRPYNPVKIDTFCLAWMLFFAVTKHQAFDRAVDSDAHWSLIKRGRFSELLKARGGSNLSPVLCDLIQKMLNPDHAHRPSPRQCLDHRWFKHGHKCPLDDRTIHGQAGVTADRLPRHPLLVRKMERQKKQQEAGGGPGAENVGGASPAGGDKLPIYEPFRRRESEPKHQQQKPAQIPHAPSAAAENVDTNLHLAQQQQQSSPSSRSTMKRSHHHVPREGGAVARASLANQVILNVTASNSAAAAGGQSSPQQPPADAGVYSARADLSLATSPAKTTAQQQMSSRSLFAAVPSPVWVGPPVLFRRRVELLSTSANNNSETLNPIRPPSSISAVSPFRIRGSWLYSSSSGLPVI